MTTFSSPAGIAEQDFAGDPAGLTAFAETWDGAMNRWTQQAIIGDPWSNLNDDQRDFYVDPAQAGWPDGPVAPIFWTSFPNRLTVFLSQNPSPAANPTIPRNLTPAEVLQLADDGRITIDGRTWTLYDPSGSTGDVVAMPADLCAGTPERTVIDWTGSYKPFAPAGPRGWLDEYCEWAIARNPDGSIARIMYTCENPSYWMTLWDLDPQHVAALYEQYLGLPSGTVTVEDLALRDSQGKPVTDPLTGRYAYDPTNKWNRGTAMGPDGGGAMHLTSPPNTLSAEVYLAGAGTIARQPDVSSNDENLICCARYGQPYRNSDPHIGFSVNQATTGAQGVPATLADPVGLYLQRPGFANYTFPGGTTWQDWYTVTRGHLASDPGQQGKGYDSVLQYVFAPPAGSGHAVGDVTISDPNTGQALPITRAGQIAQTTYVALRAVLTTGSATPQTPRSCVQPKDEASVQPWPVQFVAKPLFDAGSPTDLAARVRAGTTYPQMALVAVGGKQGATVTFDQAGVTAEVTDFVPAQGAPGQTATSSVAYILTLTVDASVPTGDVGVRITNPGGQGDTLPFAAGMLTVGP